MSAIFKHLPRYRLELRDAEDSYGNSIGKREFPIPNEEGNLVGSRREDWSHIPLFDLDVNAELLRSKTDGHYHLAIDRAVSWRAYLRILKAMVKAGLIEESWYRLVKQRGAAYLAQGVGQ
jgi:hypothetical protein